MIPDVVELSPKLGTESFGDPNVLNDIKIPVIEPGYTLGISACVAGMRSTKSGRPESGQSDIPRFFRIDRYRDVLPVAASNTSGLTYPYGFVDETPTHCARTPACARGIQVGTVRSANTIGVGSIRNTIRHTGLEGRDSRNLPTTGDLPKSAMLDAHKRQFIQPSQRQLVRAIVQRRPFLERCPPNAGGKLAMWQTCCCK